MPSSTSLVWVACAALAAAATGSPLPKQTSKTQISKRKSVNCEQRPTAAGGFPALPVDQQASRGLNVPGSLVIAGGSLATNSSVFHKILELAGGGAEARIVFFPTNGGASYETPEERQRSLDSFLATSVWADLPNPVVLMHTYDPEEANNPEFYAPLEDATGVFFSGGLPYRAYDAYFGTGTQAALERVLARGGVISGSSAGALMQSNLMCRGDRSNNNAIMLGEPSEGFSFGGMENIAVDGERTQPLSTVASFSRWCLPFLRAHPPLTVWRRRRRRRQCTT